MVDNVLLAPSPLPRKNTHQRKGSAANKINMGEGSTQLPMRMIVDVTTR